MSLLTRTYSFTDGTTAYGSQVDSEIANIVNTINNLDSAGATWTNVKVTTLLPQADVNMGSHKITSLTAGTLSTDAANVGQLKLLQTVGFSNTGSNASASSTYGACTTSGSITLSSASSKVLIQVSGILTSSNAATTAAVTIKRGASDISSGANGFSTTTGIAGTFPCSFCYMDSPGTSGSVSYTVYIKSTNNVNTVTWGDTNVFSIMLLSEIM